MRYLRNCNSIHEWEVYVVTAFPLPLQDNIREDDDLSEGRKKVVVGICAMAKKSLSKPMREILTRMQEFEYLTTLIFPEEVILNVRPLIHSLYHSYGTCI